MKGKKEGRHFSLLHRSKKKWEEGKKVMRERKNKGKKEVRREEGRNDEGKEGETREWEGGREEGRGGSGDRRNNQACKRSISYLSSNLENVQVK